MATPTPTDPLPFLLQLSDSAFPTGGYAHSHGLEEMVRLGLVRDEASLREFLERHVRPALAHVDLPLLREAHAAADDPAALVEIDALAHALKLPAEQRDASRSVGRRRLATLLKLYADPALAALQAAIARGEAHGHHVVVFGVAGRALPVRAALAAYDYQALAGFCLAALKLLRIGPDGVQRALTASLATSTEIVNAAMSVPRDRIGWFDPAWDLAAMRHEIATERLFIS